MGRSGALKQDRPALPWESHLTSFCSFFQLWDENNSTSLAGSSKREPLRKHLGVEQEFGVGELLSLWLDRDESSPRLRMSSVLFSRT